MRGAATIELIDAQLAHGDHGREESQDDDRKGEDAAEETDAVEKNGGGEHDEGCGGDERDGRNSFDEDAEEGRRREGCQRERDQPAQDEVYGAGEDRERGSLGPA